MFNFTILLIPFLRAFTDGKKYWLQSRGYTLGIAILLLESTIVPHPEFFPLSPSVYSEFAHWSLSGIVLLISISYVTYLCVKTPNQLSNTILGLLVTPRKENLATAN